MRNLQRNKTKLKYSNLVEKGEATKTDSHGNILKTGDKNPVYSTPANMKGNIVLNNSGQAEGVEYGLNKTDYSAVLLTEKNAYPISEGSLIWQNAKPKTDNEGHALKQSADYIVVKVSPTKNTDRIILRRLVNGK